MLTASQRFKDNIYPTDIAREIKARAFVELFNPDQYGNIDSLVFSETPILGGVEQLMNVVIESNRRYATLEPGLFKLDGSTYLLPSEPIPNNVEIGWVSQSMSDASGNINITATLTFINENKIKGISLHTDNKYDYVVADCSFNFYTKSGSLLKTVNIVDNTLHTINAVANLTNVGKVVVTFTRLSKPYRRMRLVEFSPGMLLIYSDADIINMTTLTEFDPFNNSLVIPEATLSVRNEDRSIDILNTDGFEPYLQQKQKVHLFLGLVTDGAEEYIHIGNYYLIDWKAASSSLTATFMARGWLDRISSTEYTKGKYTGTQRSLYSIAEELFISAGVVNYSIDASLKDIQTIGLIPVAPYKELLRFIVQASNSMYYVSPNDIHYIKPIDFIINGHLGQDQMPSPEINLDAAVNRLVVPVSYIKVDTEENKIAVFNDVITAAETFNITHDFTAIVTTKPIITGGTITAWESYDNSTTVTVTPNSAESSIEITIYGKRISSSTSDYILEDAEAIAVSGIVEKKIENPFITNNVTATNVAAYQMRLYQQRYLYNVTFRQNPLYEVGDILTMQDDFNKNYPVILTRNNINYAGYLSGTIDGRSVYNNMNK